MSELSWRAGGGRALGVLLALSSVACATNSTALQWGLYDAATPPGDGWQLMSVEDFANHKEEFVRHYNNEKLAPIKLNAHERSANAQRTVSAQQRDCDPDERCEHGAAQL